jgi:hypothetical protein
LNTLIDHSWSHFDTLLQPLWRVDDDLVPLYDDLALARLQLENLCSSLESAKEMKGLVGEPGEGLKEVEVRQFEIELVRLQEKLRGLESEWVVDGKFVRPKNYKKAEESEKEGLKKEKKKESSWNEVVGVGRKVPGGQAFVASLLARCYKLVHKIQESLEEPSASVAQPLEPLIKRLRGLHHTLGIYLACLRAGVPVDPLEIQMIQENLDAVDAQRVDGKFVWEHEEFAPGEGTEVVKKDVPKGQAVAHELLDSAYDLVHECLVELENLEGEAVGGARAAEEGEGQEGAVGGVVKALKDRVVGVRDAVWDVVMGRLGSTEAYEGDEEEDWGPESDLEEEEEAVQMKAEALKEKKVKSTKPTGSILETSPALHSLSSTLSEGFQYLKSTASSLESSADSERKKLSSSLTSGLRALGTALGVVDPVDPALKPIETRLRILRGRLVKLRNERDKYIVERLAKKSKEPLTPETSAKEETPEHKNWMEERKGDRLEIRTHLVELEDLEDERNEEGEFKDAEGKVPVQGQKVLKSLFEECYCLAYDLMDAMAVEAAQ